MNNTKYLKYLSTFMPGYFFEINLKMMNKKFFICQKFKKINVNERCF